LNIQFAGMYTPVEFANTLRLIAEGELSVAPIATGAVGIDGLPNACRELATPHSHAKVLVQPDIDSLAIAALV
jgi:threonine dehydrogenase-like Zn-dependent dehydrogenase